MHLLKLHLKQRVALLQHSTLRYTFAIINIHVTALHTYIMSLHVNNHVHRCLLECIVIIVSRVRCEELVFVH